MPIRINLLAETQEAEELRRRDPVKRAIWLGAFLVFLTLLYWGYAFSKTITVTSELKSENKQWLAMERRFQEATDNVKKAGDVKKRLASLTRMSTNRFLWGSTFNALQQTMVDHVQVVHIKADQTYTATDAVAPKKDGAGKVVAAGKPARVVERVAIVIDAKDQNPTEQNVFKYRNAIANFPLFQAQLQKDGLRLSNVSSPAQDSADPSKTFINFTLELRYPEVPRDE